MKSTTTTFKWLIRITGVIQLALGIPIWTGNFDTLIKFHILDGLIFAGSLIALAILAAVARVQPGLVALTLIWVVVMVALGLTQAQLLPGSAHWVIQVIHLLIGLGAIGQGETLARRLQARLATRALAR